MAKWDHSLGSFFTCYPSNVFLVRGSIRDCIQLQSDSYRAIIEVLCCVAFTLSPDNRGGCIEPVTVQSDGVLHPFDTWLFMTNLHPLER